MLSLPCNLICYVCLIALRTLEALGIAEAGDASEASKFVIKAGNMFSLILTATAYGCGNYFARDASYSINYSQPDSSGQKYIYFARVLTGVFTKGDRSMIIPPARDPQNDPHFLFDSVVDSPSNPCIFVVFGDAQAYPEYLITFK